MSDGELRDYYERYYTFDSLLDLYFETIDEKKEMLKQKENIIKEVREIFKYYGTKEDIVGYSNYTILGEDLIKLLEILDKEKE